MKRVILATAIGMIASACASALEWGAAWDTLWGAEPAPAPVKERVEEPQPKQSVHGVTVTDGTVRVTGYGAAPGDAVSPAQARLMAIGAAKLDALQKLAEIIEGADVSARNATESYVQVQYAVKHSTSARLRGVRVLGTRYQDDGTAEVDVAITLDRPGTQLQPEFASLSGYKIQRNATPNVTTPTTTAEAPVNPVADEQTLSAFDLYSQLFPTPPVDVTTEPVTWQAPDSQEAPTEQAEALPDEPDTPPTQVARVDNAMDTGVTVTPPDELALPADAYTDLVLDARGLGVEPALEPRAFSTSGRQLYPFDGTPLEGREPELRYAQSMPEASRLPGFGDNPLVIRVNGADGEGGRDLIVSTFDLMKMKALKASRLARGEGLVVILID